MSKPADAYPLDPVNPKANAPGAPQALAPRWVRCLRCVNWRGGLSIALFFLAWHLAVVFRLPGFAELPTPVEVARTLAFDYLSNARYWESWAVSTERVVYGFLIAQVLGIPLGLVFGTSRLFREIAFPVFEVLRPIPPLAWVPIAILFWPTNESSIVFITFIGAFFIITINVYDGVHHIKHEHIWLARSLGANRWQIFRRIMLPSVVPSIAAGMTLGMAITWNVVIAAEMISSDSGLGRMTWEGYVSSTPVVVFIGMISIGLAGFLSTALVNYIEARMMPWRQKR